MTLAQYPYTFTKKYMEYLTSWKKRWLGRSTRKYPTIIYAVIIVM